MNIQNSIKLLSAAVLMNAVWGCSSSKQVAKSSTIEVFDDMYASADESRPASLTSRDKYYNSQNEEDYTTRNPEYRGQTNKNTKGTDEYYSQNWINSRQYYQNQSPYYANNGFGSNSAWNSPYNSYGYSGFNNGFGGNSNWYGNPGISFGLGFGSRYGSMWGNPFNSYSSMGYGGYDPWGSRFGYGGFNSFGGGFYNPYAYNPFGYSSYNDPWGYNSYYGRGYGNTYVNNNYGSGVMGANGNYSNPTNTMPRTPRVRDSYSSSAYNGDYNSNRGGTTITRGSRTDNTTSGNSEYYSRPSRNNSYSNGSGNTATQTNGNTNSNSSNRSNSSWNWSNGNSNSNSGSSWGGSSGSNSRTSSGGGSSGGGGGSSGGGGGSRGPR